MPTFLRPSPSSHRLIFFFENKCIGDCRAASIKEGVSSRGSKRTFCPSLVRTSGSSISLRHMAATGLCSTGEGGYQSPTAIHTYIQPYMYTIIHTYIHTHIYIDMHTDIRPYTHTYSHLYVHNTCRHASVKASTHTCIRPSCVCSGYRRAADSFTLVGFIPTHCHSRSLQGCVWVGAGGAHVEGNISLHYEQEPFDMQVSKGVGPTKWLGIAAFWGFKGLCRDDHPRFVVGFLGLRGGR